MPASRSGDTEIVAEKLERAFLQEMLKYAGPKPGEGSFSGGIGEEQFASFLTESYAGLLTGSLDLGLAQAMKGNL
ncbi:hypothetical protein MLD63_02080 (plasmid) [Paracoccus sp. TK19116]|uniref:Rod binding protein n=1 Tax=Paracoccus albicereus TaxID=2922394 RepID=A0ABT1MLQ5_9RHOB|nr:hypothetical protein [Paracoccus albicereus]MCQ0969225.1 hypothetical protein [Paracoccus albicereus]